MKKFSLYVSYINSFLKKKLNINFFKKLKSNKRYVDLNFKNKKIIKNIKIYKKSFNKKKFFNTFFKKIHFTNYFLLDFIRDNNKYAKSQYSKSRAFCKNIVYFSLILNVIVINELHSIYYNVQINYGYFIFLIYISVIIFSCNTFFKYF